MSLRARIEEQMKEVPKEVELIIIRSENPEETLLEVAKDYGVRITEDELLELMIEEGEAKDTPIDPILAEQIFFYFFRPIIGKYRKLTVYHMDSEAWEIFAESYKGDSDTPILELFQEHIDGVRERRNAIEGFQGKYHAMIIHAEEDSLKEVIEKCKLVRNYLSEGEGVELFWVTEERPSYKAD